MSSHFERMIQLAAATFAAHNDPDQLDVDEAIMKQLQDLHPATISQHIEGDGPVCWVLFIPTNIAIMNQFIQGHISEGTLLKLTPLQAKYDELYLCSCLVLPEFRRQGIAKKVAYASIKILREDHPIKNLFVWNFSDEGAAFSATIARHEGLPLLERKKIGR